MMIPGNPTTEQRATIAAYHQEQTQQRGIIVAHAMREKFAGGPRSYTQGELIHMTDADRRREKAIQSGPGEWVKGQDGIHRWTPSAKASQGYSSPSSRKTDQRVSAAHAKRAAEIRESELDCREFSAQQDLAKARRMDPAAMRAEYLRLLRAS